MHKIILPSLPLSSNPPPECTMSRPEHAALTSQIVNAALATTRVTPYTQEDIDREREYVDAVLNPPEDGEEQDSNNLEAPWAPTQWQVVGIRTLLGCNAKTAEALGYLLVQQAIGRLGQVFRLADAVALLGYHEQSVRRMLVKVEELFSLSAHSLQHPLYTQTEKKSRQKRGRPAKYYTLPDQAQFEAMVEPYAYAAMAQAYHPAPGVVPLTEDRARDMYAADVPPEQLDEMAVKVTAARTQDPRAKAAANRRLKKAKKDAKRFEGVFGLADSGDPKERRQQRDAAVFDLANEEPISVRVLAGQLNCSPSDVSRRALEAGFVPHPNMTWVSVSGRNAWAIACGAAASANGMIIAVE